MAYTHFGARLARPGRFDPCTLYQVFAPVVQRTRMVGLHPTDAGSTPEQRTTRFAGLARRSSPRSITARRWFDSNILHHFVVARVTGRDGRCTRLLSETRLVRFQRHPPDSRDWQIWICTRLLSETKWVRFPHPAPRATTRRHSITDQCSELLPRRMRVQISLPPPCGDVVQRMRAQGYEP